MMKYLVWLGVLAATLPFWLPTTLGGDNSYHFVLTDSMKGSVDPGSFVVLRHSSSYRAGDIVGFTSEVGNGKNIIILHRIVGELPDGQFAIKGDATTAVDKVEESAITGRMVMSLPGIGFLPGAFHRSPLLIGLLLIVVFFLTNRAAKGVSQQPKKRVPLFIITAPILLVSYPFSIGGVTAMVGKLTVFLVLIAILLVSRLLEVRMANLRLPSYIEVNYLLVMVLAISTVPFPYMVESPKRVVAL